jgi:DNA-binding transcriptional MerR regulator
MTQSANIHTADPAATRGATLDRRDRGHCADEADTPLTIGEVAREFGITLRALRFYESKRLISPERDGANRLYRRGDRERITLILTGRRLGFTLAEIKRLIDGPDAKRLHLTREKCVEQINLLERQKRGIELALGELRQIYTSFYRTFLEDKFAAEPTGIVRHDRRVGQQNVDQAAVKPPSTTNSAPVVNADSSLARKRIARATSIG